jgi:hypothetical protein
MLSLTLLKFDKKNVMVDIPMKLLPHYRSDFSSVIDTAAIISMGLKHR